MSHQKASSRGSSENLSWLKGCISISSKKESLEKVPSMKLFKYNEVKKITFVPEK